MQYFLSDDEIQKILYLNKLYMLCGQSTYDQIICPEPAKTFFDSLPGAHYQNAINSRTHGIYGGIFKSNDSVALNLYGLYQNPTERQDAQDMFLPSFDFYGIVNTQILKSIARIYGMIHFQLQNILLLNPGIKKLTIAGHSYGGCLTQVLSVVLYKTMLYNKGQMSDQGTAKMNVFYENYVIPYLKAIMHENLDNPVFSQIQSLTLRNITFSEAIKTIDRNVFANIDLDMALSMGNLNVLDTSILDDPDLGLRASISAFESGNKIEGDFFSKVYSFGLINDPLFNFFDPNTVRGKSATIANAFKSKIIVGQLVVPDQQDGLMISHDYAFYINLLYDIYQNNSPIPVYSYNTVPSGNSFSIARTCCYLAYRGAGLLIDNALLFRGFTIGFIAIQILIYFALAYLGYFIAKIVLYRFYNIII